MICTLTKGAGVELGGLRKTPAGWRLRRLGNGERFGVREEVFRLGEAALALGGLRETPAGWRLGRRGNGKFAAL